MTSPASRRPRTPRIVRASQIAAGSSVVLAGTYWALMSPYSQLLGAFPYRGATGEKVVALTFDDGPNEPYTSQIADFLDERGIHATFFQVGRCVERHAAVTSRLAADGHVIGNHSYSHDPRRCITRDALCAEQRDADRVFHQLLGRQPALYRPPWLLRTPALLKILRDREMQPVSGSFCHSLEVFQPDPERIARGALAKLRPGCMLIFHDGYDAKGADRSNTVAALKIVVDRLSQAGYRFTTADRLLGVPAYSRPSAGC
jgi:peptidoglycan/xylan/chitin deacetylase (PgdA/CDA1 family)